jgi:hypothetical protein
VLIAWACENPDLLEPHGRPSLTIVGGRSYYAAADGSASGDGSLENPWDLESALAGANGVIRGGDTIWLRGGTYRGSFEATVGGTQDAPVVFRQYPGERAIIDGATGGDPTLAASRPWVTFWGFEVTNSDPDRQAFRPNIVVANASNTKFVNLVVHDGGTAFFTYSELTGVEVYGSIIYNNGWQDPGTGGGHALYLKSDAGVVARDNVMFNQFGFGVHAYTDPGLGRLVDVVIDGNVAFNNGSIAEPSHGKNILLGGEEPASGAVIRNNMTYSSPGLEHLVNAQIGFGTAVENADVLVEHNYLIGGHPVVWWFLWDQATVRDNVFLGANAMIWLEDSTLGYSWGNNTHHRSPAAMAWRYAGEWSPFTEWVSRTGLATAVGAPPSVLVGAGNIARCDWGKGAATAALVSGIAGTVFTAGDNVRESGSDHEFMDCYGPTWGAFKDRTRPAAGDNDYETPVASGYFNYFGAAAGPPDKGYYTYERGDWQIFVLNSSIGTDVGSEQERWLRSALAASNRACRVAYWHHPRFSSYSTAVRNRVKPLWDALYEAGGTSVVINGHHRIYERFAPQTPDGEVDLDGGIRQFTVGTGGHGEDAIHTPLPTSEVREAGTYGVLKLTLRSDGYDWEFVPIAGQTFTDRGTTRAVCGEVATDTAVESAPTAPRVFVRPNKYEAGRAHIVVYNWPGQGSVIADVSAVLQPGWEYEVRSVQNLFAPPIISGIYGGGTIAIPMTAVVPAPPVGGSTVAPRITGPAFDVFLLTRR